MKTVMLNGHKQYKLPRAVYYQCLWTVKDMDRLEQICDIAEAMDERKDDELVLFVDERRSLLTEDVIAEAKRKLKCIQTALEDIPEEYRDGIMRNIKDMLDPGDSAHSNTWKHWKQRFIYSLAKNLRLY